MTDLREMKAIKKMDVKDFDMVKQVKWNGLKFGSLKEHKRYNKEEGDYSTQTTKITHLIKLTPEDYDKLIENFMMDWDEISGLGGTDYEENEETKDLLKKEIHEITSDEWKILRKYAIRLAIRVVADDREEIFIDPQGYSYCRYVGMV